MKKNKLPKIKITKSLIKEVFLLTLGAVIAAVSVYFFKAPNHFVTGGVSGIGIIINSIVPGLSVGTFIAVANTLLVIIGFLVLGKKLGIRVVYCSLLFSACNLVFEQAFPMIGPEGASEIAHPLTDDPMFESLCGAAVSAIAASILFNNGANTGGTDIITMIVKKYSTFNISTCILIVELAISASSGFSPAIGWEKAGYSIMSLVIQVVVVNIAIENLNHKKQVTIITANPRAVCDYINNTLHRGATVVRGLGAYTGDVRYLVYTILNPSEAMYVKRKAKEIDEHGFVIINNTTDIIGKGFRQAALDFADEKSFADNQAQAHMHHAKPTMPQHPVPDFDAQTMLSLGLTPLHHEDIDEHMIQMSMDLRGLSIDAENESNADEE